MDLNNLQSTISNLTLYDLKAGVRKVQNAVMNYTEMEAKVREATNNEPWGSSSSLMQEIANGTFNYQTLNEIMPMIYRRFTEKAAEEWRQIYKALQLLEYLIKHGSERVIDDARGHITLLKMLRQFHYIDQNGKDQGINVRNRAKELAELLSDVDRIRTERKKARANKAKYTGVEGGATGGFSSGSGSGSRYGGFGSETGGFGGASGASAGYGGYSGGVYGDGGGFGGQEANDYREPTRRADQFEEYDEFDDDTGAAASRAKKAERTERAGVKKTTPTAAPPKKAKEPEVDLFSFDDPEPTSSAATTAPLPAAAPSNGSSALASLSNDDDEFDDFQSATPVPAAQSSGASGAFAIPPAMITSSAQSTAQFAAPQPVSGPQNANISNMMSAISPPPSTGPNYSSFSTPGSSVMSSQASKPVAYQPSQPNYFQSVQVGQAPQHTGSSLSGTSGISAAPAATGMSAFNKPAATPSAKPAASGDPFANLWGAAGGNVKKSNTPASGPKLGELAKEKTSASLWGAPAASTPKPAQPTSGATGSSAGGNGLDDLLG
ncbi:hypothetical protein PG988_014392 [Apiospora saccharicola]